MNQVYVCPTCKNNLEIDVNHSHYCGNCEITYNTDNNYIDFIPTSTFYAGEVPKIEMEELINNIDKIGYNSALNLFFQKFPHLRYYITNKRRIDWIYNVLGSDRENCLDLGSGLGNISDNLSLIFKNVYSHEAVRERIEFQKRKFKNSNRSNIYISRGNALSLPFKDNYFDFIVCNGVLEWIGMMNTQQNPRETQLDFLRELKRVLRKNGKIYIGIENRTGLNLVLGGKDHSGIRYTSLMPRFLASLVVKKYGNSGGIYGDSTINKKEERGYFTYTYTIYGYRSLFKDAGLKVKSFWVFPSYNQPYLMGRLEDKIGLKGFLDNALNIYSHPMLSSSIVKFAFSVASKINKSILQFVVSISIPSFLFYCSKDEIDFPMFEYLKKQTSLTNITLMSYGEDLKYLLYDKNGKLSKIVHMKRDLNNLPERIIMHDKTKPDDLPASNEKIWMEDWIPGRIIDPNKFQEIKIAMDWLINFQKTSKESMSEEFLANETKSLRTSIRTFGEHDLTKYLNIIDEYEHYLTGKIINIAPEHGDYFYGNILIDSSHSLHIIDWVYYRKKGDPFFDPVFFIVQLIIYFKKQNPNLATKDIITKEDIKELKSILDSHFGQNLDLRVLILYTLVRFIERIITKKGILENELIIYSELIDELLELKTEG